MRYRVGQVVAFAALLAPALTHSLTKNTQTITVNATTSNNGTTFPGPAEPVLTLNDVCPEDCPASGISDDGWSAILSVHQLNLCTRPMLFDTSLRFPIESPKRQTLIRACTIPRVMGKLNAVTVQPCVGATNRTSTLVDLEVGWAKGLGNATTDDIVHAATNLQHAAASDASCNPTVLFAKAGNAVLGLYAGAEVERGSIGKIIQEFIDYAGSLKSIPSSLSLQLCGKGKRSAPGVVGITASTTGDINLVHKTLGQWIDAKCVTGFDKTKNLTKRRITSLSATAVTAKALSTSKDSKLQKRDTCKYIMVESGDTCDTLSKRCGISVKDLESYNGNGGDAWCSGLMPNKPVCCSSGDQPDLRPQKNSDGTCASYQIQDGDLCYMLNQKYYLNDDDLDKFNKGKTWGWAGCSYIQKGQKICLSDGTPPMPTWLSNAVCGPQKPGTKASTNGTKLADLNQCPLNVCCNIWGQCGTTGDFCVDTSVDNTPGTAATGTYGCVSNCGMEIVNNSDPPSSYSQIAYWEAFNRERPCLHMDVTAVKAPYTHIHFAFGDITTDFVPSAGKYTDSFHAMLRMQGIKRIMSFGGWAFSNDPGTNHIMRSGVTAGNRQGFADNIVKFVKDNGLDGVDFDWEYPGADDIQGSDPGTPEDGPNYLEFLKLVRAGIGNDKSLSIAAPASYWYLRHFPIAEMSEVVSYIVYMTYDLHGQWDVGNKFVSPGCDGGNCLRSHINATETKNALAMITKAGVKANKVMVGITSYGRSFKMSQAGCEGPMCTYLGGYDDSAAMPGKCTQTGGYISDAEIESIQEDGKYQYHIFHDDPSDSDIMVYNDVEWVAHMTDKTKKNRMGEYQRLNFAGTSDWAIDLQGKVNDTGDGEVVYIGPEVYTKPSMHCDAPCTIVLAPSPLGDTTTITIPVYTTSLIAGTQTVTVTITPSPIVTGEIQFYNIPITVGNSSEVQPYPSVHVADATVTYTFTNGGDTLTSTRIVELPPWPIITNGPPKNGDDWSKPPNITQATSSTSEVFVGIWPKPSDIDTPTPTYPWDLGQVLITPIPDKVPEPEIDDDQSNNKHVDDGEDDNNDMVWFRYPCDLWFFNICDWAGGFRIRLPKGIIGPGPPPMNLIQFLNGWDVFGPLPPFPEFDNINGKKGPPPSIPPKPNPCEETSASLCGTTTSYGTRVVGGKTETTTSSTYSTCNTIYGCYVKDLDQETTTASGCTLQRRDALPTAVEATATAAADAIATASATEAAGSLESATMDQEESESRNITQLDDESHMLYSRLPAGCKTTELIIFPKDIHKTDTIVKYLDMLINSNYLEKDGWSAHGGLQTYTERYTAWFYVEKFPDIRKIDLTLNDQVAGFYDPVAWGTSQCPHLWKRDIAETSESPWVERSRTQDESGNLTARAAYAADSDDWGNAFMSFPRKIKDIYTGPHKDDFWDGKGKYHYNYDDSAGAGQTVYVIDVGFDLSHPEFAGQSIKPVIQAPGSWFKGSQFFANSQDHGTSCAAIVNGKSLGVAPKATVVPVSAGFHHPPLVEGILYGFMVALDDLLANGFQGKGNVLISASLGIQQSCIIPAGVAVFKQVFDIIERLDIPIFSAAGNDNLRGIGINGVIPPSVIGKRANSLLVGSINRWGQYSSFTSVYDNSNDNVAHLVMAAGQDVRTTKLGGGYQTQDGTSFAAPRVAGLAAYFRGLPTAFQSNLKKSPELKKLIIDMADFLQPNDVPKGLSTQAASNMQYTLKHVWNGQIPGDRTYKVDGDSCLFNRALNYPITSCNPVCPQIKVDGIEVPDVMITRADNTCSNPHYEPDPGSGGSLDGLPVPDPIEWTEGDPSPVCSSHCGTVCDGFFCSPNVTGIPPEFNDPNPPPTKTTTTITITAPATVGAPEGTGVQFSQDPYGCTECTRTNGGPAHCGERTNCTPAPTPTTCLVQYFSSWTYGGEGPGQSGVDNSDYALYFDGPFNYEGDDDDWFKTLDPTSLHYKVQIPCARWGCIDPNTNDDGTIHTTGDFDLVYRGWKGCALQWNGQTFNGKTRSEIESNTVSKTYYYCEIEFECTQRKTGYWSP